MLELNHAWWLTGAAAMLAMSVVGAAHGQKRTPDPGFRIIDERRGILVSVRDEPGRPVPTFRGQGNLQGSVLHLLAIMLDDARASEWAKGADETYMIRAVDAHTNVVYSRSKQPWPVHDRDLVMKRTVELLEPGAEYRVRLTCMPGEKPKLDGVVRVPYCDTTLHLRKVDADTTYVDYQVSVDPGGSIPDWLIKRSSKDIPFSTLVSLEKQAKKTRGQYEEVEEEWATEP